MDGRTRPSPPLDVRSCRVCASAPADDRTFPSIARGRTVARVITVVRVAWALLMLVLALLAISFVMGVGTPSTGPVEKVVFLLLTGGCVYAAAKLTALTERLAHRSARR